MENIFEKEKLLVDWMAIVKEYAATVLNMDVSKVEGGADMWLANRMSRLPTIKPRKVYLSDIFSCDSRLAAGWHHLQGKIEAGSDLAPHLSRGTYKLHAQDGMMTQWGINHFHLGISADAKNPHLVEGGKEIVYAFLEGDGFYALGIMDHSHWEDINLLEVAKRNWPHLNVFKTIMAEVTPAFDAEYVSRARKDNFNVVTHLSDGSFLPPRGVTLAGTDAFSALKACHTRSMWLRWQAQIEASLQQDKAITHKKLDAKLVLEEDGTFSVVLPEINETIYLDAQITISGIINSWRDR